MLYKLQIISICKWYTHVCRIRFENIIQLNSQLYLQCKQVYSNPYIDFLSFYKLSLPVLIYGQNKKTIDLYLVYMYTGCLSIRHQVDTPISQVFHHHRSVCGVYLYMTVSPWYQVSKAPNSLHCRREECI